jgi:hypothetical protein
METAVTTNPRMPVSSESEMAPGSETSALDNPPSMRRKPSAWRRWINHLAVFLFVLFCTVIGLWLSLLPWSLQWTDNPLLWTHPDLQMFLGSGFVRGICSGLGLLDLWIGIREAADYYERIAALK